MDGTGMHHQVSAAPRATIPKHSAASQVLKWLWWSSQPMQLDLQALPWGFVGRSSVGSRAQAAGGTKQKLSCLRVIIYLQQCNKGNI